MNQLDLLKKIAAGKTLEEVQAEEKKEEIIKGMDEVIEKSTKKSGKKKYLSGDWVKTDWGWRWEGEKDKEGRPILRKENASATMYHISRPEWVWEEGDGKDAKQYNVWCVKFKKSGKEYLVYKKDGELHPVKFVKKPFDLANRLYVTGHAYQQKGQGDGDK